MIAMAMAMTHAVAMAGPSRENPGPPAALMPGPPPAEVAPEQEFFFFGHELLKSN